MRSGVCWCVMLKRTGIRSLCPQHILGVRGGRGLTGGDLPWFTDYGIRLSSRFRSLKVWMSLKEHGALKYGRMVQQNIAQARYLAGLVEARRSELEAPVSLNIVCFRYNHTGLDNTALDDLNKEILVELQEQGIAVLSGTTLDGRYVMRAAHTNHRSRWEDFDLLVREVVRIGEELGSNRVLCIRDMEE